MPRRLMEEEVRKRFRTPKSVVEEPRRATLRAVRAWIAGRLQLSERAGEGRGWVV